MMKLDSKSKDIFKKVKKLRTDLETNVRKSLYEIGKELQQTANKEILSKNKTGRVYYISDSLGRKRKHVSSARGESWANRTGKARKGIEFRVKGSKQLIYTNSVDYVTYLEDPSSLNRRAMWNSIQKNKGLNIRILKTSFKRTFKGES